MSPQCGQVGVLDMAIRDAKDFKAFKSAHKDLLRSHRTSFATLGAGAVILWQDQVVLTQINYSHYRGQWILPGGGLEPFEMPQDAAVREAFEETGLEVECKKLISVRHKVFLDGTMDQYWVFLGELKNPPHHEPPKLVWPQDELLEVKFWKISEALKAPEIRPMTRKFIEIASQPGQHAFKTVDFEEFEGSDQFSVFAERLDSR
jgi:ADP-ribose pyrophosphatase YjhB (NUDIX family)